MANSKKYIAEFEVNADGAITNIKKITDATDTTAGSINNLKTEIRELQKELANTDPQSKKYADLSLKIGQLKDQVNDAAEAIKANAGGAFENFAGNAGLVASRLSNLDFAGAASAVNGLADATKKLKFSELNKGAGDLGKGLVNLGKSLLTNPIFLIGTAILLIITNFDKLLNVFPPLTAAFEAIKATLGFIVNGIKAFTDAIGLTEFATADALDKSIAARDKAISDLDRQEKRAVLQAKKNGQDVTKIEEEYANKRIAKYNEIIAGAEKLTREGAKLTEDQVKAVQDAKNALDDIDLKKLEKEAEAAEKAREEQRKKEEEAQREREKAAQQAEAKARERQQRAEAARQEQLAREKAVTDTLKQQQEERYQSTLDATDKELRIMDLKYQKLVEQAGNNKTLQAQILQEQSIEQSAILQRAAQKEIDILKAAQEETRKIKAQQAIESIELEEQVSEELRQSKLSVEQQELDALRERYFERSQLLEQSGQSTAELTELYESQKKEIEDRYAQERKDKADSDAAEELEKQKQLTDAKLQIATQALGALSTLNEISTTETASKIADIDKQISNAQTDEQKKTLEKRRKVLEAEGKKAFERNKLIQIGQALIQTYQSATGAYASQMSVPTPDAPVRAAIAAGLAVAAGLAMVAKIQSTQYSSGGGGGGGGSSPSSPPPATSGNFASPISTNMVGNGVPQNFQNRPPQPTQAYVLAGDVSDAQNARSKVEDLARLTG